MNKPKPIEAKYDSDTGKPLCPDCKRIMLPIPPIQTGIGKYTNSYGCYHSDKIPKNGDKVTIRVVDVEVYNKGGE